MAGSQPLNRYSAMGWDGDAPGGHHRKGMLRFKAPSPSKARFDRSTYSARGRGGCADIPLAAEVIKASAPAAYPSAAPHLEQNWSPDAEGDPHLGQDPAPLA